MNNYILTFGITTLLTRYKAIYKSDRSTQMSVSKLSRNLCRH